MKCWWRKARLGVAAVVVLAGTFAGSVQAAVLVKSDFKTWTGRVMRDGGMNDDAEAKGGWRALKGGDSDQSQGILSVDLAQAKINPLEGTFDFMVKRAEEYKIESLFTLKDVNNVTTFGMSINWVDNQGFTPPAPNLESNGFWRTYSAKDANRAGFDPWIPIVPFKAARGQTFRVTVTWGGGKPDRLFINGMLFSTHAAGAFSEYLKKSVRLEMGVEHGNVSFGHSMTSTLLDFRVLNVATADRVDVLPKISSVSHDAVQVASFSGKLVAGNTLGVTVQGTSGGTGSFDLVHFADVNGKFLIDWRGWSVYPEEKVFYEEGEVNLRDVDSYKVYASLAPFDYKVTTMEPLATLDPGMQQYTLETPEVDKPYYIAVVAVMRDGTLRPVIVPLSALPMLETTPGTYTGSYKIGWNDRFARAAIVAHLDIGGETTSQVAGQTLAVDPSLTLAVATSPNELKADSKSVAKISVTVTDANGKAVPDHEIRFMLFTTSQYTGVVGGGAFAEQVGGTVKRVSFGKTDLFGTVSATYVAGFAAKTAVIVARDMLSNSTGAGWVKTYITATAQLQLEPVTSVASDQGYEILVTSSDEWLTADGESTARITARVTMNNQPVEGHSVDFSVSSGAGTIRVVTNTTNKNGEARAVYTAGKKIGMVLISATDKTVGITGSVQIELRSDAPAKIAITLDPEKLPADGHSKSDLSVLVTDINDNPNDSVEVEYAIVEGSGKLQDDKGVTDRNGKTNNRFVAGKIPGRVTIELTVRSTVPTPLELTTVNEKALAVTDYKFF